MERSCAGFRRRGQQRYAAASDVRQYAGGTRERTQRTIETSWPNVSDTPPQPVLYDSTRRDASRSGKAHPEGQIQNLLTLSLSKGEAACTCAQS